MTGYTQFRHFTMSIEQGLPFYSLATEMTWRMTSPLFMASKPSLMLASSPVELTYSSTRVGIVSLSA